VYGIHLSQRRNDAKINSDLFNNIVTKNKDASRLGVFGPFSLDLIIVPAPG